MSHVQRGTGASNPSGGRRKHGAIVGMVLGTLSWFVLLFACYGGAAAACPDGDATWVKPIAVACAVVASLGMAAAVSAYRESAGDPSADWLLGAAGLYVTTLAWAGTVTGAAALFFIDVCSL